MVGPSNLNIPPEVLVGIKVVDFSRVLAGPYASMFLADLGADVIKVESPEGDSTRAWKPPVDMSGESTYFTSVNRGKRSIVLDLKSEEGKLRARELAQTADVVIQNFMPGTMGDFGIGYEEVAEGNPGVVYCSISGFGEQEGASLPGYDLLVQAVGGLMSITGQPDGEPTKVGVALVDVITGLNAVIGIFAALRSRDNGPSEFRGKGQHVRVNLLSSLLSALVNQAASTLATGEPPSRQGNAHPSISPYETFSAKDQTIALAIGTDLQFSALCRVLGLGDLITDERFETNEKRVKNRAALRVILNGALKADTAEVWITKFQQNWIPAGRVNTIPQAFELAEALGLNSVVELALPGLSDNSRTFQTIANPIDLSSTPVQYRLQPPSLDEHEGAQWLT